MARELRLRNWDAPLTHWLTAMAHCFLTINKYIIRRRRRAKLFYFCAILMLICFIWIVTLILAEWCVTKCCILNIIAGKPTKIKWLKQLVWLRALTSGTRCLNSKNMFVLNSPFIEEGSMLYIISSESFHCNLVTLRQCLNYWIWMITIYKYYIFFVSPLW